MDSYYADWQKMAKLVVPELDPALPRIGYWNAFKAATDGPLNEANPYAQSRFTWCTKDDKVTVDGLCHHLYPSEVDGFADGKRWLLQKLIVDCVKHAMIYVPPQHGYIGYYKCNLCSLTASEYEAKYY